MAPQWGPCPTPCPNRPPACRGSRSSSGIRQAHRSFRRSTRRRTKKTIRRSRSCRRNGAAYVRGLPLDVEGSYITDRDAKAIVDLCDTPLWRDEIAGKLLAGWIVLAPLAGWLYWRPSIWITGPSGSGKSWILDHIVRRLLGNWAVASHGGTTEAGIRQALGPDALPEPGETQLHVGFVPVWPLVSVLID